MDRDFLTSWLCSWLVSMTALLALWLFDRRARNVETILDDELDADDTTLEEEDAA